MKLKLEKMGKAICSGPLVDHGLLETPWPIGAVRVIDDLIAHQLLGKYPDMFRAYKGEDKILTKVREKPKNKVYEDKIIGPKGVK